MRAAKPVLLLSLLMLSLEFYRTGPALSDLALIAILMVVASVVLVFIDWLPFQAKPSIVVDGSNVMHWKNDQPSLATVAAVLQELTAQGYRPIVWFDANVGYKVGSSYMGPEHLSGRIRLSPRQIRVAPKGTPADPLLLGEARQRNVRVVTNDRFRDWVGDYPMVETPGFLVRGRISADRALLEIG